MADLAESEDAADGVDHIVRSAATRFINDERSIVGRRTCFAGHGETGRSGPKGHPLFCGSVDSKEGAVCAKEGLSALFGRKEGLCSFRDFRCDRNIWKHAQPAVAVPREDARGPPVSSTTGRISTILLFYLSRKEPPRRPETKPTLPLFFTQKKLR